MQRKFVFSLLFTAGVCILSLLAFAGFIAVNKTNQAVEAAPGKITQGALQILRRDGAVASQCPLKYTAVKTDVSGGLARTTVTQEFSNPLNEKIEAVYVFPLPVDAAVDDLTMFVGDRTIKGRIKRREEARQIYEAARNAGQLASLLDQERPNIFTQSVANIAPGASVKITISYVETLKYEDGAYELVFPMVVGPRYIPGQPIAQPNPYTAPDTSQVPDASRITPPITPEDTRAGHDISLEVSIDAGVPLDAITAKSHIIDIERPNERAAIVRLKNQQTIPNKDFVLRFDVAGKKISDAVLAHRNGKDGFFTLMLQPPERVAVNDVMPKEIVFVLDTSGSMMGFPIEKAKEAMRLALDGMNPRDTFNLITFAGDTRILFPEPVPATRANLDRAQSFLRDQSGRGGTEMMRAIRAALDPSDAQDHVRIVCFMTDGYVGNDFEIISEIQKHPNARVFSFGIGESVNRFLLDQMAREGRGEVEYVSLQDDGSAAARRFHERVQNPLLTDIQIDWGGLPVTEVYPKRIPDLFSAKPLVLTGRYANGARGTIRLSGRMGGRQITRELPVVLPDAEARHDVLASLWARTKIDDLMRQDFAGLQSGQMKPDVKEAITQLGLEHRLMTQFTSLVAVEERVTTEGGQPRRIDVPVEMPEGVSYDGIFGEREERKAMNIQAGAAGKLTRGYGGGIGLGRMPAQSAMIVPAPPMASPTKPAEAYAAKRITVSGSVLQSSATQKVQPSYPAAAKTANASGAVQVQIVVDEAGQVVDAQIINGHPLLRQAALDAARQWQFKPIQYSGKPIRVAGVLTFNFTLNGAMTNAARAKLDPPLVALVEQWEKGETAPAASEAAFVRNGKARVRVALTNKRAATVAQLQTFGFEIITNPKGSNSIVGWLPIEKLAALAELSDVKRIAPLLK